MAHDEALIGCIGKMIVASRGAAGPGEVLVRVRGGSEAFIAWSADPLPRGATVLVHRVSRPARRRRQPLD